MTYLLVSRDPRSGIEARISVPNQALARRAGLLELDDGRDLVAIHATSGEWPITVAEIEMARVVRAGWRRVQGREGSALARSLALSRKNFAGTRDAYGAMPSP
jgi:hypothetical protein